jgi:hypothetical protein
MEQRREQPKTPKAGAPERKKRFRIIKLEERVAPKPPSHLTGGKAGGSPDCTGTLSIE